VSGTGSGTRLGLTIPVAPFDVVETCRIVKAAEAAGYSDAWSAEVNGSDAFAVASAVGIVTENIRIGCAIVPAFTRPPALIAMGAATAQQATSGRFCLGIGASSPVIVESWMGQPFVKPYARMKETVAAVKAAFAGEKVTLEGETLRVKGFKLDTPPATPIPLFLAALGPKMRELAAREADGIALFLCTEDGVRITKKAAPGCELVARITCFVGEEPEKLHEAGKWILAPYLAVPGYNRFIAEQGFEAEAEKISAAWKGGDRKGALDAVSERLVDALIISGPAEACRERLQSFREAGLDVPIAMIASLTMDKAAVEKAVFDLVVT
jgi:probable F420-dependent oxidoreductase